MAARIDREVRTLQRRLAAWLRQKRTRRNESVIAIGERAIREKLRTLGRRRRLAA